MTVETLTPLRVVRHNSPADRWTFVFGEPDPRLRPYVIHSCGYDETTTTTCRRRIELPGVHAPLILDFGPPVAVRPHRPGSWLRPADGFVAGLDDTYTLAESTGSVLGY